MPTGNMNIQINPRHGGNLVAVSTVEPSTLIYSSQGIAMYPWASCPMVRIDALQSYSSPYNTLEVLVTPWLVKHIVFTGGTTVASSTGFLLANVHRQEWFRSTVICLTKGTFLGQAHQVNLCTYYICNVLKYYFHKNSSRCTYFLGLKAFFHQVGKIGTNAFFTGCYLSTHFFLLKAFFQQMGNTGINVCLHWLLPV